MFEHGGLGNGAALERILIDERKKIRGRMFETTTGRTILKNQFSPLKKFPPRRR